MKAKDLNNINNLVDRTFTRIENKFEKYIPNFRCFGCASQSTNSIGLALEMLQNDQTKDVFILKVNY